jgi:alanyl-tRNA synthetase
MTSAQIRQSFLDFFKSKQHTIVRSFSLMPDSPNLLFTNAGMNQFVPIFLGQKNSDVSKWAGAIPRSDTRAADTQKCIRAGGKHNDLDDVGLDTYHHTFFEMLGNWSFGDYFKREAIEWAWELVVDSWKFPANRLYATVFCPYLGQPGWADKWRQELEQVVVVAMTSPDFIAPNPDASPFEIADQEAAMYWAKNFRAAGLDPFIHIVPGNKKDNFWMMGETGPCGPCSELHIDLTPAGDTQGALVNQGDARCIEIWNLVFIQFNAEPGNRYSRLPARHVDTGMGFERVTSIMQGTKDLKDFASAKISNYETDIFRPLFDAIEKLSGRKYRSTLPPADLSTINSQQSTDVAFRVIADHIRTLSFAIADGIQPGNTDRNYVLRRILRRAVRYGRTLGFHEPFFYKLVDVLADTMGDVFPEIRAKKGQMQDVIKREEEAFNKTLDNGIERFYSLLTLAIYLKLMPLCSGKRYDVVWKNLVAGQVGPKEQPYFKVDLEKDFLPILKEHGLTNFVYPGGAAFELYDTYGFPLDLTELMARERGLTVDKEVFEKLMEEQRNRARTAKKKEVIEVTKIDQPTLFVGYDVLMAKGKTFGLVGIREKGKLLRSFATTSTPFYAEMGGQVGDTGTIRLEGKVWHVINTVRAGPGPAFCHVLAEPESDELNDIGKEVELIVDRDRRNAIQRHHTVTHLLHWALHEVANREASQKGSFVGPDKLTFDFNSAPLMPAQVADIEKLVNERILENAGVSWTEVPYADVKNRRDVMQFFGDKYGDTVRVVQIGGRAGELNGYSMELCGGTHTRATGEIGLFRIVGENAIAAGVRRIEAVAGLTAYDVMKLDRELIKSVAGKMNSPIHELEKKIENLLAQQKELEKQVKTAMQRNALNAASELLGAAQTVSSIPLITHNLGDADGDFLQAIADSLKGRFKGVVVLGGCGNDAVSLVATVSPEFTAKVQAGKIIQAIAPIVGGKGGGKPDNARGGGKDASKLDEALAKARSLL